MKKTPFPVSLDAAQLAALKWESERTGASIAELVRRAIAKYLARRKTPSHRTRP
jgi:hypothetical protein